MSRSKEDLTLALWWARSVVARDMRSLYECCEHPHTGTVDREASEGLHEYAELLGAIDATLTRARQP